MTIKSPLLLALAAAVVGSLILAGSFVTLSPVKRWPVISRDQAISKAREVAKQFGFDASKANATLTASVSNSQAFYMQQHPNNANARLLSPLSERVKFGSAEIGIDSAGVPTYWNAPDEFNLPKSPASENETAQRAFTLMSSGSAALFSGPSKSMADDPKNEEYVWKLTVPRHSDVRDEIRVTVDGNAVKRAERKVSVTSDDVDSETGDTRGYWDVFGLMYLTIATAAIVALVGIYILWLVRRSVNHLFPLILAGVAVIVMSAAKNQSEGSVPIGPVFFSGLLILCLVTVGRGISITARPKWMSMEQLCWLAPKAKATGESILAGLLCSPLLAAIPFLIVWCGLFPQSAIVVQNAEILYSRIPLVESLNIPSEMYLLGFFGFGIPLLGRMFRLRWVRWAIALPVGTIFFADATRVVTGPVTAPLVAGFLTLVLFGFLYKYFDLLAVILVQLTSGILLATLTLGAKNGTYGELVVGLVALLLAGCWILQTGQAVSQGDPRATTPTVAGFRGEREKLQAEFSVARRAQQGMLPLSPPIIPGYSIAASCTPSLDVGGDLYDFLQLQDGRIGIGVADVSGKGVPAALYMTLTKGLLASVSEDSSDLATVVDEVNRHLHGVTRKKVFVTMALGFLDAEKRILECVRAGHNPMVWRQPAKDSTTLVAPPGLGLGITASKIFGTQLKVQRLALSSGDAVVFYSDGVTEAMNAELEQFGEQRLMDVVAQADNMDATATHDSILTAVRKFLNGVHPQDDMTLVVLRVGDERMMVSG